MSDQRSSKYRELSVGERKGWPAKYKKFRGRFRSDWNTTYADAAKSRGLTQDQSEKSSLSVWSIMSATVIRALEDAKLRDCEGSEVVSFVDSSWQMEHVFSEDRLQCCSKMTFRPVHYQKTGDGETRREGKDIKMEATWRTGLDLASTSDAQPLRKRSRSPASLPMPASKKALTTEIPEEFMSNLPRDVVTNAGSAKLKRGHQTDNRGRDWKATLTSLPSVGRSSDDSLQLERHFVDQERQRSTSPIDSAYYSSTTRRGPKVDYKERVESFLATSTSLPSKPSEVSAEELPRPWYDNLRGLLRSIWRPTWQVSAEGDMTEAQTNVASITGEAVCWIPLATDIALYEDEQWARKFIMVLNQGSWNVHHGWEGRGAKCISTISFQPKLHQRHYLSHVQWSDHKITIVHEWNPNEAYQDQSPEAQLERIRRSESERIRKSERDRPMF